MKKTRKWMLFAGVAMLVIAVAGLAVACRKTTAQEYTLTFINGDTTYKVITAVADSDIAEPEAPAGEDGKQFAGWSLTRNGTPVELPTKMPTENRTYYAVFSNVYSVTLDVGDYGTLETTEITPVRQGTNLYELVKDIKPTAKAGVDPVFGGWFYENDELKSGSTLRMPGKSITLTARYKVEYTTHVFMQKGVNSNEYTEEILPVGFDWVNKSVTSIPTAYDWQNLTGYNYKNGAADETVTLTLSPNKSNNIFRVFYDILSYNIVFNANAPDKTTATGSMTNTTAPHNVKVEAPVCNYAIDGYRFAGWSESAQPVNGTVQYATGDEFSLTRGITLYAVWDRGMVDATGLSADLLYVRDGKAYLQRQNTDEKVGRFTAATGTFRFEGAGNTPVLRGILSEDRLTYIYTGDSESVLLYTIRGGGRDTVKLVEDDGTAVYVRGGTTVNGTYRVDSKSGDLQFVSHDGADDFRFRLFSDGDKKEFAICGQEAGTYYNIVPSATAESGYYVDDTYSLELDGYGNLIAYASGYDDELNETTRSFLGTYTLTDDDGTTVVNVTVYRDADRLGSETDSYSCTLRSFEDTPVYEKVGREVTLAITGGAAEQDKIVLSGNGTKADYYVNGVLTNSGSYMWNEDAGTLEIYDTDKNKSLRFNRDEGVETYSFYDTFVDTTFLIYENFSYIYDNLDALMPAVYRVYQTQGVVEIQFAWVVEDTFYNIAYLDLITLVRGQYSAYADNAVSIGNDMKGKAYWFHDGQVLDTETLYYTLTYLYRMDVTIEGQAASLNYYGGVNDYDEFVFHCYDDGLCFVGDVVNSFGKTVTVDGVSYKLDGLGTATEVTDAEGPRELYYAAFDYGVPYYTFYAENFSDYYFYIDDAFVRIENSFAFDNAAYSMSIYLCDNGKAILACSDNGDVTIGSIGTYTVNHSVNGTVGTGESEIAYTVRYCTYTFARCIDSESFSFAKEYEKFDFAAVDYDEDAYSSLLGSRDYAYLYVADGTVTDKAVENKTVEITSGNYVLEIVYTSYYVTLYSLDGDTRTQVWSSKSYADQDGLFGFEMHGNTMLVPVLVYEDYSVPEYRYLRLDIDADGFVTGFTVIDAYSGYYLDYDDGASYIVLSGIAEGAASGTATYYQDGETAVAGTYAKTGSETYADEMRFTSEDGETTITFRAGVNDFGQPIIIKALPAVDVTVKNNDADKTTFATVTRGAYDSYYVMTFDEDTTLRGFFTENEDKTQAQFTSIDFTRTYIFSKVGADYVLCDATLGTYTGGNGEAATLDLDGLGNATYTPDSGSAVIGKYEYDETEETYVFTASDQTQTFAFILAYYGGQGYYFVYDTDLYGQEGVYADAATGYQSLQIDGFGNAMYVDGYGREHEGVIVKVGETYQFTSYAFGAVEMRFSVTFTENTFTVAQEG